MSSPEEVAAEVWGGKSEDWKLVEYSKYDLDDLKEKVLKLIDKSIEEYKDTYEPNYAIDGVCALNKLKEEVEKL